MMISYYYISIPCSARSGSAGGSVEKTNYMIMRSYNNIIMCIIAIIILSCDVKLLQKKKNTHVWSRRREKIKYNNYLFSSTISVGLENLSLYLPRVFTYSSNRGDSNSFWLKFTINGLTVILFSNKN